MAAPRCHGTPTRFHILSERTMVLVLAFLTMFGFQKVLGAQFTVGDSVGWGLGNDLGSWATQFTFHVGDDLYFPYPSGQHSVLLVNEEDYKSCNIENPITSDNGMGDMVMTLASPETYFFICGVPGHCEQGLRLSIVVKEPEEAPPTTITPPPPDVEVHDPPPPHEPVASTPSHPPPPDSHTDTDVHAPVLSPPYYTKYNTFHRNSSPKVFIEKLAYLATLSMSLVFTLTLV